MGASPLKESFDIEPASEQECLVDLEGRQRQGWGNTLYEEHYPLLAYEVLSSDALKTKAHLCVAFACSKPTINRWIGKYPEFREAVECGLSCGEVKFRDKVRNNAFKPSKEVNNGLIKMMGSNVYGIEEHIVSIVESTTIEHSMTAEEEMKERGIPMPGVSVPDLGVDLGMDLECGSDLPNSGTETSNQETSGDEGAHGCDLQTGDGAEASRSGSQLDQEAGSSGQPGPGNLEDIHLGGGLDGELEAGELEAGELEAGELEAGARCEDARETTETGAIHSSDSDDSSAGSTHPVLPSTGRSNADVESGVKANVPASIKSSTQTAREARLKEEARKEREKALAIENARLRAQVQAQESVIKKVEKDSRKVKEFGHDFTNSDDNVCSPFGDIE